MAADALDPPSYEHLLFHSSAVVHTLGTLFDDLRYKKALKDGDMAAFMSSVWGNISRQSSRNPLRNDQNNYERLNRDAGMRCFSRLEKAINGCLDSIVCLRAVYSEQARRLHFFELS